MMCAQCISHAYRVHQEVVAVGDVHEVFHGQGVLHPQCNMLKYLKRLSRYSTPYCSTTKQGLGVQWEEVWERREGVRMCV